jgi:hypothetical protein
MHPLFDNLKSLTFEELEKRNQEIHKRMQIYVRNHMQNPLIWDQLQQMQDAIHDEKQERAIKLNQSSSTSDSPVVVNTDPLESDAPVKPVPATSNKFNPIS